MGRKSPHLENAEVDFETALRFRWGNVQYTGTRAARRMTGTVRSRSDSDRSGEASKWDWIPLFLFYGGWEVIADEWHRSAADG
jgi:hypothetical protein